MNVRDEEFGEPCLIEAAEQGVPLNAADLIRHILAATDNFTQGAPQRDDVTLVVARILQFPPSGRAPRPSSA